MWINFKTNENSFNNMNFYTDGTRDYYYSGIFFLMGYKAGENSIRELAKRYEERKKINFLECMGSYNIVIKEGDQIIFFSSNALCNCLYYNDSIVSDSVFEIISRSKTEFDEGALSQFFMYDMVFCDKTYIKGVFKTNNNCYYKVVNKQVEECSKEIGTLENAENGISIDEFSGYLTTALADIPKVLSLTGGYDSRLVLSMFLEKGKIDASICGSDVKHDDFVISKKVADAAKVKYTQELIDKPNIQDEYIREIFLSRGGYHNIINESIFRLNEYIDRKKKQGYECLITGDTGVFHKADGWTQYFPFYNFPFVSIESDYNKLVLSNKKMLPLSDKFKSYFYESRHEVLNYLGREKRKTNTKNCDWFSWYLTREALYEPLYNGQCKLIDSYAPLLEYRLVVHSYNICAKKRLLATNMKEYISSVNKDVARIPTAIGATASSEKKYIFRDLTISLIEVGRAGLRFLSRFTKTKIINTHSVTGWNCEKEIRNLQLAEDAIIHAKYNDWVAENVNKDNVPYNLLVKLMEVYLVGEYSK